MRNVQTIKFTKLKNHQVHKTEKDNTITNIITIFTNITIISIITIITIIHTDFCKQHLIFIQPQKQTQGNEGLNDFGGNDGNNAL